MFFFAPPTSSPKPSWKIPTLEVLDRMVQQVQLLGVDFNKTAIFAVQHHLETTATLYQAFQQIGIAHIYSTGKYYSTSTRVEAAMQELDIHLTKNTLPNKPGNFYTAMRHDILCAWEEMLADIANRDIETILILDDGGRGLELMPRSVALRYKVAGIEQTQAGLYSPTLKLAPLPIVQVASSALKKNVEPPLIAIAAMNTITTLLESAEFKPDTVFGVIGFGAIGQAITHYLISKGFHVFVYDHQETVFTNKDSSRQMHRVDNVTTLINRADYVLGCTGKDVTEGMSESLLNTVTHEVTLLSVSSEDKEFRELLQLMMRRLETTGIELEPLGDIHFRTDAGGKIHIIAAGTPINFLMNTRFGQTWNVPASDIAVTQGALFGAVVQAYMLASTTVEESKVSTTPSKIMLNPHIQQYVVEIWNQTEHGGNYSPSLLEQFQDTTWIAEHSGGDYARQPLLEMAFIPQSISVNNAQPPLSLRARL